MDQITCRLCPVWAKFEVCPLKQRDIKSLNFVVNRLFSSWSYLFARRTKRFVDKSWKQSVVKGAYSSSWNSPQNYGTPLVNGITQCYLPPDRGDFTPNRAGWYLIYRPRKDERLSWPSWLVTYRNGLPVHRRSPILVLTGSDIAQLRWLRPTRYH